MRKNILKWWQPWATLVPSSSLDGTLRSKGISSKQRSIMRRQPWDMQDKFGRFFYYQLGNGVPKDFNVAAHWFQKAYNQDNHSAIDALNALEMEKVKKKKKN